MKTYLSHDERQISTYFAICYGLIETVINERGKNLSQEEITALKYSRTHLEKYIHALIKRVGRVEGDRIFRLAQSSKVEIKPKKYEGQFIVDKEALEEVARIAVEAKCFGCTRVDWHNCGLYQCQKKMDVGSTNDTKGKCEFWYDQEEVTLED